MGKYGSRVKKEAAPKRGTVNPYMRGIGCLFMLVVPVFSYAAGSVLAEQGFGYQIIPPEWYGYIRVPPALANFSGLNIIFGFLASIPHLAATLAIAVIVMIIVGGLISVIFGLSLPHRHTVQPMCHLRESKRKNIKDKSKAKV